MRFTRVEFVGFVLMFVWAIKYLIDPEYDTDLLIVGLITVLASNIADLYQSYKKKSTKPNNIYLLRYILQTDPISKDIQRTMHLESKLDTDEISKEHNLRQILDNLEDGNSMIPTGIVYLGHINKITPN